jgi:hypothetical protein
MLTLVFQEHKTGKILMAYIPNENKTPYINPANAIKELGNKLKIGTPIRISFLGSKFLGAYAEGAAPKVDGFTFRGTLTKVVGDQQATVAKISLSKMAWAMPLENVGTGIDLDDDKPKEKYPPPSPDPELLANLEKFQNLDIVDVDYKTQDFNFFLTDIRPHTLNIVGTLIAKQKKPSEGNICEFAVIRTRSGQNYTMRVPYEDTKHEKDLSVALAELKIGETVEATGRRIGGVCLLDSIGEGTEQAPAPKPSLNSPRKNVPKL